MGMFLGPMAAAALLCAWWLFASRLRWSDRFLGVLAFAAAGAAAFPLFHSSFGAWGMMLYALPAVTTAWVAWLLITVGLRWPIRRAGLFVVFLLAWGYFDLLRFDGADGSLAGSLAYRWIPTAEDNFQRELASRKPEASPAIDLSTAEPPVLRPGDWSGFRGPNRDGRLTGVKIATNWSQHPPRELWRRKVGPGWSSFAVVGTRLYTQEQWGTDEVVICYHADTGAEIWIHRHPARFTEPVGGPGPRATPTFHEGTIYAQGANGRLDCLDAATGEEIWSRDIAADSSAKVPTWGFASSPLIVDGVVTVFAGGEGGKSVLGYDARSGDLVWSAGEGKQSYCSLQLASLDGVEQLLIATDAGVTAFEPAGGRILWEHEWPTEQMARVVQPAVLSDSDVLIGTGFGFGARRLHVAHEGDDWKAEALWTTTAIKPYFNDLVIHDGHLYGFDSYFFTCVNLDGGKKKWRVRGYGNGEVLLLADQNLLLVLSETGEVALVEASPAA
ncbi:MAG TPA: PQQ-binding-like beta-propeller repeat protein, partial [Pirellulales bacterium]|nr:PQQ-binding-like beta-propeller repeat protein [Pirellulales bacterium]